MSKERTARAKPAALGRMWGALLLAGALVCAAAQPPAGHAGALRRASGLHAVTATEVGRSGGIIAFSAGGEIYVAGAAGGGAQKIVGVEAGG
jgi:hypothetical protein